MDHTYLFEPAVWELQGRFIDRTGATVDVAGNASISHDETVWVKRSSMRPQGQQGLPFENVYQIAPFEEGSDSTTWTSSNSQLGKMSGHFVIVDDAILSISRTADGRYRAVECFQKLADDRYLSRGALVRGREKMSSWVVELRRTA
jgi:hypothetical protein